MRYFPGWIVGLVALLLAVPMGAWAAVGGAHAAPAATCERQVLMLHDMAGTAAEMRAFARRLDLSPECLVVADYGRTPLTRLAVDLGGPPIAGLTAIDDSAAQIAALMRARQRPESSAWTVVAHGAGGLVAQRVHATATTGAPIEHIITVGPLWRGTNIAFLGDSEQISRRLGTYDAILAVEKPLIDPWCGGCRELIAGSDLLTDLHRDGLPSADVRYTNVISPVDGLVSDPRSAALPGARNHTLDTVDIHTANHFALLSEPAVGALVRTAIGSR
ncbi:putative triacylglycerol lipase [Gordonia hirsuta DSM 44140 = NBRC 16056]|uniref:Putative triacylglycerol lipase n=1 Tax=Gordonia hirsuta DSM 44140 = NBRC 16056 TaxID=1121927 RepID=L7L8G5_9ACTN|nr:hypothetical protein [Gordonia hirsuta]GAC56347.1 putative triacylglycerol lipase [Gordonia hirsuta DSM 44140 = NBRC 16056]